MESFTEFLLQWGYIGLFIGAALPLSAEMLLLAFLAIGADPVLAVAAATLGNWTGGMILYMLGRLGKWGWLEKYTKIGRGSIERFQGKVERYGSWLGIATGLPVVGDLIGVAMGFFRVSWWKSAVFMLIGRTIRFAFFALIFYLIWPSY